MSIIRISCSEPRPFLGTWEGDGAWLERDWIGGLWPLHLTDGGQPSTTIPKNITPFWPKKYRKIIKTDDVPHLPITIANYVKYSTIATVLQEKNQDKQIWPQYGGFRGVLFSAFLFLSCASCQSESGLAANVYSAFTIIGWGKPELSLGAFSWRTRSVVVATIWRLLVVHVSHLVGCQIDLGNQIHCYLICFLNSKTGLQEHRHQIVPWNEKAWLCCDIEL